MELAESLRPLKISFKHIQEFLLGKKKESMTCGSSVLVSSLDLTHSLIIQCNSILLNFS